MSPEFGSPTIEHSPKPVSTDFGTAVGEFMFSPDVWRDGLSLVATAGRAFSAALGGTQAIASMTLGSGGNLEGKSIAPNIQPNVNPAPGGGTI